MASIKTHIRRAVVGRDPRAIYCRATPHESISYRHFVESLVDGSPQQGHVATLPSPLCEKCAQILKGK